MPYAAAGVEHKGPLPFAAYALSQVLFGHSIQAARLLAWIAMVVTALVITAIARRLMPEGSNREVGATSAGALYALIVGAGGLSTWWSGAQAESFMEPFAASAVLLALGSSGLAAGVMLGMAMLGKPLALLLVPALLIAGAGSSRARALRVVAGIALPWIIALIYFGFRGAASDFIDQVFPVNLDYGRRAMALAIAHPQGFVLSHDLVVPLVLLTPVTLGAIAAREMARPHRHLLAAWLFGAYLEVILQGRFSATTTGRSWHRSP